MPYLNELSPTTQNLVMMSFEFFGKKMILGIAILFSLIYVFYWYKKQEKTPYLFWGIVRVMLYIVSWATIVLFPFMIIVLYPQVSLELLIKYVLMFYGVGFFLAGMIVLVNIYYFSGVILFRLGGFESDKRVVKVFDNTINRMLTALGLKKITLPKKISFLKDEG